MDKEIIPKSGKKLKRENMSIIIVAIGAYFCGWVMAHYTVAEECKRLGAFYVRNETFHCYKITKAAINEDINNKSGG